MGKFLLWWCSPFRAGVALYPDSLPITIPIGGYTPTDEFFLRSPNASAFGRSLVLVHNESYIDADAASQHILVVSRFADDGVYFHFVRSVTINYERTYTLLAYPYSPPRALVETYIL